MSLNWLPFPLPPILGLSLFGSGQGESRARHSVRANQRLRHNDLLQTLSLRRTFPEEENGYAQTGMAASGESYLGRLPSDVLVDLVGQHLDVSDIQNLWQVCAIFAQDDFS